MTAVIVPGEGESLKDVIRALLELTEDPTEIRTTGRGDVVRVPQELADKYTKKSSGRRGGRPRKTESTETTEE